MSVISSAVFLLYDIGHLIPTGDDETGDHDGHGLEAVLEQCRLQNRQMISEMRESLPLFQCFVCNCKMFHSV